MFICVNRNFSRYFESVRKFSYGIERAVEGDRSDYHREYSSQNKESLKENRSDYGHKHYLRNKETKMLSRCTYVDQNNLSMKEYYRDYYDRFKEDKRIYGREYYNRTKRMKLDTRRGLNAENRERKIEVNRGYYSQRKGEGDYRRFYYLRKKERNGQECLHNGAVEKENILDKHDQDAFTKDISDEQRRRNIEQRKEYDREYYLQSLESPSDYSPGKSWKNPATLRGYFESIANEISITTHSDWYRVSRLQIVQLGGKLRAHPCSLILR